MESVMNIMDRVHRENPLTWRIGICTLLGQKLMMPCQRREKMYTIVQDQMIFHLISHPGDRFWLLLPNYLVFVVSLVGMLSGIVVLCPYIKQLGTLPSLLTGTSKKASTEIGVQ